MLIFRKNLDYINSRLDRLRHLVKGSRNDELNDMCLVLNLLYRVNHRLPFLQTKDGEFLSDNLESEDDPILNPLPEQFKESEIFHLICQTYHELSDIAPEDFSDVYAEAVENAIDKYSRIRRHDFLSQPKELTQLVYSLVKEKGCKSVFNPFSGISYYEIFFDDIVSYSQDIDKDYRMIGRIRLDANHKDVSKYYLGDSVSCWNDHGAECIVSTLPYDYGRFSYFEYIVDAFSHSSAKYAFLITTPGSLYSVHLAQTRRIVTNKGMLGKVVFLPAGLFTHTGIPYCLIVLDKEKQSDKVLFADISDLVSRDKRLSVLNVNNALDVLHSSESEYMAVVDVKTIIDNDYQWNPKLYISFVDSRIPNGFVPIKLEEIISKTDRRSIIDKSGYIIKRADLEVADLAFVKEPSSFRQSDDLIHTYRIEEPSLLIPNYGQITPLYVLASTDHPVYVSDAIFAFGITNKEVDPSYLCLELSKINPFWGRSSSRLDIFTLYNLRIPLVPLDEQRRIYNEAVDTFRLNKAKELGLMEVIEKMKTDYINTVRNRKHDMKTPMTQLRSTLTLLKSLITQVPENTKEKFTTYLDRQEEALDKLSMIVSHLADEQVFSTPEPVNLDEILSKEEIEEDNYTIKYQRDAAAFDMAEIHNPIVMMGKADAVRLFQNIISNAITHGFVDPKGKYSLTINLTIEDDFYVVEFINNGKPLPDGIDKERYGINGIKSKGSSGYGTGGFVVKSIAEHYGGDYDIFSRDSAGEKLTYVIVKLPIYLGNE